MKGDANGTAENILYPKCPVQGWTGVGMRCAVYLQPVYLGHQVLGSNPSPKL